MDLKASIPDPTSSSCINEPILFGKGFIRTPSERKLYHFRNMANDVQSSSEKLSIKVRAVHPRIVSTDPIMHCYLCGNLLFDPIVEDHLICKAWGGSSPILIPVHDWCNGQRKNAPYLCSPEDQREMISKSTKAGLARAKANGKTLGGPRKLTPEQEAEVLKLWAEGWRFDKIGEKFGVSHMTIRRIIARVT